MLRQSVCLLPFLVVLSKFVVAAPLAEKSATNVVRMPVTHRRSPSLHRRQFSATLENVFPGYMVETSVGSTGQAITLSIDTGSSDIWMFGPGSCSTCEGGIFDPSQSATIQELSSLGTFQISYFDGSSTTGNYYSDSFSLGGVTIDPTIIAVATSASDRGHGIMGIGLDGLEAQGEDYPGVIDDMYNQGLIGAHAYSLYLDDLEAATGSIIFGGYDSSKWTGSLVSLPIVASSDGSARLSISWNSISATDSSGTSTDLTNSDLPYPVVLDTGYTYTVLPNDLFTTFYDYLGATTNSDGSYSVSCSLPSGSIDFGFGDGPAVTISVPFSELAVPLSDGTCGFGLLPSGSESVISFGDTFLRSAYVLYNYDDMTISLAQASWDTSCSSCAAAV